MAVSRRTVTVLFADVADSTPLGERLDPETLRQVMSRYFDCVRTVLERHGGTVEKFIGDAVMAVFGVPELHEDDALRAVRAAAELREALARLNDELERDLGVHVAIRVGVNTGEVVAGDGTGGQTLVTGDAVNTAKRLEEACAPSEILVGEETERLVRGAALLEPMDPVSAKGKTTHVHAWRLLAAIPGIPAIARRFDTPLVGRAEDLARLRAAYERAVGERVCYLFTLLGAAGIGKSRLASELFDDLGDDAHVLVGRCLPYGDGITFWPLSEVLQEIGSDEGLADLLADTDDAELVVERLCGVTGRGPSAGPEETFWAVRRVCETLARRRPLVLCFEDVHWAEPTFLDLIEYLSGWVRDAPILLLCLARPEFLDERPTWLSGQEHAASLTLQPLSVTESEAMLDALGASGERREGIIAAAEGNPLYVEQLMAMLAEDGGGTAIPPTIQALLAARLDRLSADERAAIERAAVAGKEFWRDAVVELTPEDGRGSVGGNLLSLVRKDLIRPHRSSTRPDDAFRFGHALIRDAAYAGIPKETRAELHERFAAWLEANSGDRAAELDEFLGYHLEQAYRYREQLGPLDDRARALAERAGEMLGAAGRRAFARDDMPAALTLLDRAVALVTHEDPARLELVRELSMALWWGGEVARAEALLNGLIEAAAASGDRRQEWSGLIERAARKNISGGDTGAEELLRVSEEAIQVFQELGDDAGLGRAWRRVAYAHQMRSRFGPAEEASERALVHVRRAGDRHEEARIVDGLCTSLLYGPARADEAIDRCEQMLAWARGSRVMEANVGISLAGLKAMRGEFDAARALATTARHIYEELGLRLAVAGLTQVAGPLELLAGDLDAAERELRQGFEIIEPVGSTGYQAALLAEVLYQRGNLEEADRLATVAETEASADNIAAQVVWRGVRAKLGRSPGLAREAVALADRSDALNLRADALVNLAEILQLEDRSEEASAALRQAVALYDQKGNVVASSRALSSSSFRA